MVQINIPTPLRKFTDDHSKLDLEGNTVLELIENLTEKYPSLRPFLLDGDSIRPYIKLFLGDQDIDSLERERTSLKEGDILSIIPAIAGGAI
ncbi:MAG: molybdopterin synthase sulfur carrier subunit [Flavobacteriales bacterium]|nr:molybdopterin synthase sulfur carrier subunit [Flavobacteriales bacterium]